MSFQTDNAIETYLEAELADGLAISPRLLRSSGRGQLDVIDAKVVKGCVRLPGSVVCKWKRSGALGMVTLGTKRMRSQHEIGFSSSENSRFRVRGLRKRRKANVSVTGSGND